MTDARAHRERATDWPHPASSKPPPDAADQLQLLYRLVHDEAELRRVLVHNPAELFGYDAP